MNQLAHYRKQADLSQQELADLMVVTQSTIGSYESGRIMPPLDKCRHLVKILNDQGVICTLDDVFPPE